MRSGVCAIALLALLPAIAAAPARAQDQDLNRDADGTSVGSGGGGTWNLTDPVWSLSSDGVSGPYRVWDNLALDNAIFGGTAGTVTLTAPITVHDITFNTSGYVLTGNTLTLAGVDPTISVTTGAATIASIVSSTNGLIKAGAGTLTLSNNNSFAGGLTVNAGTLFLTGNNSFGSSPVITGGALSLTGTNSFVGDISVNGTLTASGAAALGDVGNNIIISGGSLNIGATGGTLTGRTVTLSGVGRVNISGAGIGGAHFTGTGGLTVSAGVNLTDDTNNYTNSTAFGGAGGSTFSSIGNLGEASSLGAPTTVADGTIGISNPSGTAGTRTVSYVGDGDVSNRNWVLTSNGYRGTSLTNSGTGTLTLTGAISVNRTSLARTPSFTAQTADLELLGVISGNDVAFNANAGLVLRLGDANTFASGSIGGAGKVEAATLANVGVASSLGTGGSTGISGTLSYVGAGASTNRSWGLSGTLSNDGAGALTLSGGMGLSGTGTLGGSFTGADNVASGVISGAGNLRSAGAGTWVVSGTNTYTGQTIVDSGTLRAGAANAFTSSKIFQVNGGTLDLNDFDQTLTTLTGTGGTLDLGTATLTLEADEGVSATYAGSIAGSGGLTKFGGSTQTLTGASTYTGDTTIGGGTLNLDFSGAGGPASDIIGSGSTLSMGGGVLNVIGAAGENSTQTFDGLDITAGNNAIDASSGTGGSITVNLGAITRTGGLMNFELPDSGNITTTNLTLGGWATVNGTDYAKVEMGNILAFEESDYTEQDDASQWISGQFITEVPDVTGFFGTVGSSIQLGGLRYTEPVSTTVTVAAGQTLGVDGAIIVAPTVEDFDQLITGGMITGAIGGDLGVRQNSEGNFTIDSQIVDNGGPIGFVKAGTGLVTLGNANNNYTGSTLIAQGTLSVGSIGNGGVASGIGASSADASNLVMEGGILRYTGTGDTSDRGFTFLKSGDILGAGIEVTDANANLSFSGLVTSPDDANFTKSGAGTLTLANPNNDYVGITTVTGGLLSVNTLPNGGVVGPIGQSSSDSTNLVLDGGGLQYTGVTATTDRGFTLGANDGTVDVTDAGTEFTVSGTIVGPGNALIKEGDGTLILSGTNTYTGGNTINGGVLRAGSTQAFGGLTGQPTTLADVAGATLDLNDFDNSIGPLNGGGTNGGNVTLGSATLRIAAGNGNYSGVISGTGGVWRTNGGTQTFNGCNHTYTGSTRLEGANISTDCLLDGGLASGIGASTADSTNLQFINGTLIYTGGSIAIDRGFQLLGGTGGIQVTEAAATLEFEGDAIGGGSLSKSGAGTLVLSGTNTYTGNTAVSGGVLRAAATNAFGPQGHMSLSNAVGVLLDLDGFDTVVTSLIGGGANGGNIDLGNATLTILNGVNQTYAGAISGSGNLVQNGNTLQALSGCDSDYTGTTTINAGTLQVTCLEDGGLNSSIGASSSDPANLVINGTLNYVGSGGSTNREFTLGTSGGTIGSNGSGPIEFSFAGPVTLAGANTARSLTLAGNNIGTNIFSAQLDDNGTGVTSLTKTGNGLWRLTSATSSYTGVTTISGGILEVDEFADGGMASSIGAATSDAANLVIGNGSTLRYTGAGNSSDRQFTLDEGVTFIESAGTGALQFTSTGAVGLTGTDTPRTIALGGTNTGDNTFGGAIGDNGTGATTLAKNDSGTWILTGNNMFTGNTVINDGNLMIGNGGTSGNAGAGNVIVDSATSTLSLNRSDTFTFSGTLSGPGTLAQIGAGTSVLTSASNSIGATTIGAGALQVDGGLTTPTIAMTGTSALTVNGSVRAAGGTAAALTGDAGASTITVNAGATLAANGDLGDGSDTVSLAGTLATGAAVLNLGLGDDTLILRDGGTITGAGVQAGTGADALLVNNALAHTLDGASISGFESLTKQNDGVLTLIGAHDYSAGTTIAAGTLRIGNGGLSGTLAGNITNDSVLAFNRAGTLAIAGQIVGAGSVNQLGPGTTVLTADNSYTGGTTINAGTLQIGDGGTTGAIAGNVVNNATIAFNRSDDMTFAGLISGAGALRQLGAGTLTLTADNTYAGLTTITAGTLQLGNGGVTGGIAGNVLNNGALAFNRSDTLTFGGAIFGTGSLTQAGPGTTILTGPNSYSGATNVDAGTLLVNGDQSGVMGLTSVASGATLGGTGTIGGDVAVADGGTLAPGSGGVGALTINGSLSLAGASRLDFQFGQANAPGSPLNDIVNVGGDLTLDGTIDVAVSPGGAFDIGLYRIVSYGGALTDNGLAIGAMPAGSDVFIQTAVAGQVNLINTAGATLNFWDGAAGPKFDNAVNGGDGIWQNSSGNDSWTEISGAVNAPYTDGAIAIFSATPGTVTIDNSLGAVTAAGMQFASDDYRITGNALTLTAAQSVVRVGDGTASGVGFTATIDAELTGAAQLVKTDAGTLVLSGTNSYTGGTLIDEGTLRIASDANLGDAAGGIALNDATLNTSASFGSSRMVNLTEAGTFDVNAATALTLNGTVSGAGALVKDGDGVLILAAANTYGGGTTVDAGILQIGDGGTTGSLAGDVVNNSTLAFNRSDSATFAGTISGSGAVNQLGLGSTILTADNSYTGGTTIDAGTLQLGAGGNSGGILGDVLDDGALVFNRSDAVTFTGLISGSGNIEQAGSGITILTGSNSYTGATTVSAGILLINGDQSAATGDATVSAGGALGGIGTIGGNVAIADSGTINPGDIGSVPGMLAIAGNLDLAPGAVLDFNFGQANIVGGALNDLVDVGGDLVLDGTLNVTASGGGSFDPGIYRVINYGGTLTNSGLTIGTIPSGTDFYVQTSVVNQVNLINTDGLALRFWDGASGGRNDGLITGGDGVWQNLSGNDNWTLDDASINAPFLDSAFAIFSGTAGTVAVDESLGAINVSGMQFATDGYVIEGDPIHLAGAPASVIRVGDGTTASLGYIATINAALVGTTQLVKADLGTLELTGTNSYAGGTRIDAGTLRIASDANLGDVAGGLDFNGGTLNTSADITANRLVSLTGNGFFATNAGTVLTLNGVVSGAGEFTKVDAGSLVLTAANSYSGNTVVTAGSLFVNGDQSMAAGVTSVASGATLGGSGIIGGNVSLASGAFLSAGNNDVGTLTINGNLALSGDTALDFEFGQANSAGGSLNDLVEVGGDLTLDGTINVSVPASGSFGPGIYRVFNYGGTLTDNGLTLGTLPDDSVVSVQTAVAGQVNLVNTAGLTLSFWDGTAGPKNNNAIDGDNGVWRIGGGSNNWTDASGALNADYAQGSFAIFSATPGTVTVDNLSGAVLASGMQFASDGYVIAGGPLTLTGAQALIQVGDGSAASAGYNATISAELTGSAGLAKTDLGTLVLTGANSYTGGTAIDGGTLQIGNGGATGSITGDIANNAALVVDRSGTLTLDGTISGTGSLTKLGGSVLTLTGTNSYAGGTTVGGGTVQVSSDANLGDVAGTLSLQGGTLQAVASFTSDRAILLGSPTSNRIDTQGFDVTLAGIIGDGPNNSGGNFLDKLGSGMLTFTGANTYSNRTVIAGGTLALAGAGTIGAGNLVVSAGSVFDISQTDAGARVIQLNSGPAGTIALGSKALTLGFSSSFSDWSGTITDGGIGGGPGGSVVIAAPNGAVRFFEANSYTGGTTVAAGTFVLSGNGSLDAGGAVAVNGGAAFDIGSLTATGTTIGDLSGAGAIALGGKSLTFGTGNSTSFSGTIAGNGGALVKTGTGTFTLAGANSYTGGTTISGGTLQIGNGGTSGSIAGDVLNNGTLAFDRSDAITFSGAITGGGALTQAGTGTTILTADNSYAGATYVTAGTLLIDGDQSGATGLTGVASGATLGGTGIIGGSVTVADGGSLAAGSNGVGALTINGNLALGNASQLAFEFGQANVPGGPFNDVVNVGGDLTLGGTINVTQAAGGSFGPGVYRVINYTGTLTDNGLAIGTLPSGTAFVQTVIANQVNLVNTAGLTLNFWDGAAGPKNDNLIQGGNGVWRVGGGSNDWTEVDGLVNADYTQSSFAIFQATPGTVTIDNGGGNVLSAGMQFAVDGYTVTGDALTLTGAQAMIRIGDGGAADTTYTATIGAALTGSAQLVKDLAGTLVLTGTNSYTGGTAVNGGTLRISADANLGDAASGLSFNGGMLNTTANIASGRSIDLAGAGTFMTDTGTTLTLGGLVSGAGALTKDGTGTLVLAADNNYAGGTTIAAGTLQIGNGGTAGNLTGNVTNNATLAFNRLDTLVFSGTVSGSGSLSQIGSGTTTLTADSDYAGGTTIAAGTLQIGNGGMSGSITGDVLNNGTLAFNRADGMTFAGLVTGSGTVAQAGAGTTILTGANSYTGATNVDGGTLLVNGDQSVATGLVSVASGATLGGIGTIGGDVSVADSGILAAGAGGVGVLTINGSLGLTGASQLAFEFGQANVPGGPLNDLVNVGGDLTLDGTLNVTQPIGGSFGPGVYRIFNYAGALTDNGLTVGSLPSGTAFVQTVIANQVNLVNTAGLTLNFWDGAAGPKNDGLIQGGNGTWRVGGGSNDWTEVNGAVNADYAQDSFAIFQGTGGTVTVDNSGGDVLVAGMQFTVDGYSIAGDPLTLTGTQAFVRVGDGTPADTGVTTTIDAALTGATQLVKDLGGTLILTGANSHTGGTAVNGGTLRISADANLGDAAGGLSFNGGTLNTTATFGSNRTVDLVGAGTFLTDAGTTLSLGSLVSGAGALTKDGTGTLVLTAASSYAGGTTISAGILQLGVGGTTGSITGDVVNNAALLFNRSDAVSFAGLISGAGRIEQVGSGTTILTGANNYAGTTTVSGGTLLINGDQSAAIGATSVASGAALGGTGVVGGDVTVADSATLAPGEGGAGTLTINGNLSLASGSQFNVDFGAANAVGSPLNDVVNVGGDLTLDGTIDVAVTPGGAFDIGLYRVVNYGGTLTDNGLALGTMPTGADVFVQTSVANQVNLINSGGATLNFWDGAAGPKFNSAVNGGDGVWQNGSGNDNWADATGAVNASYDDGALAIFTGAAGTVTIDNSLGAVAASGLQFAVDGYTIAGDALTLIGPQSVIRVGDGTAAGAGYTATISSAIIGASQLVKTDAGTLELTGVNSYASGTAINGGTIRIASDANLGAAAGDLSLNGGTLNTTADMNSARAVDLAGAGALLTDAATTLTLSGTVTGAGVLTKSGAGTLVLSGTGSHAGATNVGAGTLLVNGDYGGATGATGVASGASVGGTGTMGGDVTLADGATLTPGAAGAGTLTISGGLALASGSRLAFEFGQANMAGGALNDLVNVGGDLVLDGTIDVTVPAGGAFDVGVYRVFNYGGALTDNGLTLGTLPAGSEASVQTSIAGQVNLVNSAGLMLSFWDGIAGPKNNGVINGGDGIWQNNSGNDNWTDANGAVNAPYDDDAFAVFGGTGGAVIVDDSLGGVTAVGMQFATDGYTISGDGVALTAPQSIIRVGDGSTAGAGFIATINSTLSGDTQLVKTDAGTLILGGANSYTGGTLVSGGTVQIADDANLGDTTGDVTLDDGMLATSADLTSARGIVMAGAGTIATADDTTFTLDGLLSGTGALTKAGAGTLFVTGDNSGYTGATTVAVGTLAVTGELGGAVAVDGGGRLEGTGRVGDLTNGGTVAPGRDGFGTLTVGGSYTGNGGTLEIEAVLSGDASQADRLVIAGGTSGTTSVNVTNRGGLGAQTVEGIKIIDVTGGTSAGTFALNGDYLFNGEQAVIAGAFGYRLYQGGVGNSADGDWYLRSALLNPVEPNEPQGPLYQPGVPVYEAYGLNLHALNSLPTLQQRVGNRSWAAGAKPEGSGIWGRIESTRDRADAAVSTSLADQNVDSWKMQLGADHVLAGTDKGERLVAGVTVYYGEADSHVRSIFGNGSLKTHGYGIGATLTWYGIKGFYIDGQAQFSRYDSDLESDVLGGLARNNDGNGEAFSLEMGKRTSIGENLSITPQTQMVYSHVSFDRFTDPAGAVIAADKGDSLKNRWGISLDHRGEWAGGRSHLYGLVNLNYEWLDGTRTRVSGTPIDRANARLSGELGIGGSINWRNGVTLYSEISANSPLKHFGESHTLKANAGIRMVF